MTQRPAGRHFSPDTDPADDFLIRYGESLRVARLEAGLTQIEVAERSGLHQSYIAKIEAGKKNIGIRTMQMLADVVDHDLSTFFAEATQALTNITSPVGLLSALQRR